MKKSQVALLCVVFFGAGLALGFGGHDFIAPNEETKFMEQLAEEEQDRQKRIKEDAVANSIIMKLQSTQATLLIFSMKERIKMEDCDLGTALATPELVREKLKDHVKDPDMYNDGHWIFQSSGGKWWVGYKLDDVPKADRQKLVQRASFSNLYKTVNEDDGAYDGGDVVFMPI